MYRNIQFLVISSVQNRATLKIAIWFYENSLQKTATKNAENP